MTYMKGFHSQDRAQRAGCLARKLPYRQPVSGIAERPYRSSYQVDVLHNGSMARSDYYSSVICPIAESVTMKSSWGGLL